MHPGRYVIPASHEEDKLSDTAKSTFRDLRCCLVSLRLPDAERQNRVSLSQQCPSNLHHHYLCAVSPSLFTPLVPSAASAAFSPYYCTTGSKCSLSLSLPLPHSDRERWRSQGSRWERCMLPSPLSKGVVTFGGEAAPTLGQDPKISGNVK